MAKKIPGANVKVTSGLNANVKSGKQDRIKGSVKQSNPLSSTVSVPKKVSSAPVRDTSPFAYASIKEVISKVFRLQDSVFAPDFISLFASKVLRDQVSTVDLIGFDFTKALQSVVTQSDVTSLTVSYSRIYESTLDTPIDHISSFEFTKVFSDYVNPVDLAAIYDGSTFTYNKTLRNTVTDIVDTYTAVIDYNRTFDSIVSQYTETYTFDVNKVLTSNVVQQDNTTYDFSKKVRNELQRVRDTHAWYVYKPFREKIRHIDDHSWNFIKDRKDSVEATTHQEYNFEKVIFDDPIVPDFFKILMFEKPLYDDQPITDYKNWDFNKRVFEDQPILDDITSFDYHKELKDSVIPVDLAEIYDGSNYSFIKSIHDFVNVYDTFSRLADTNTDYTEDAAALDYDIYAFIKVLAHSVITPDHAALDSQKPLYTYTNELSDTFDRTVYFNRTYSDAQYLSDDDTFNFNKVLYSESIPLDDISTFDIIKRLSDYVTPIDLAAIYDGSNYTFNKSLRTTVTNLADALSRTVDYNRDYNDDQAQVDHHAFNLVKAPIHDSTTWTYEGPGYHGEDEYAFGYFAGPYTVIVNIVIDTIKVERSFVENTSDHLQYIQFTKSLYHSVSAPDIHVYDLHKPLYDIQSLADHDIIHLTKAFADSVTMLDMMEIFDGSLYDITLVKHEEITPTEDSIFHVTLTKHDEQSLEDYKNWNVIKPLYDSVDAHLEGPVVFDSDDWAIGYAVSGYIADYRIIFDLHKPLSDIATAIDNIGVLEGLLYSIILDKRETIITPDHNVYNLHKPLSDIQLQASHSFWHFEKALEDSVTPIDITSVFDGSLYAITLSKQETIIVPDYRDWDFHKPLTEDSPALDHEAWDFHKPFSDILDVQLEGPILFDSDGWAEGYVVSGYIADYRIIFDLHKELSDFVITLDNTEIFDGSNYSFAKALSEIIITPDVEVYDLHKPLSDVQSLSDFESWHLSKALADSVITLDNTEIFDGSSYSFAKVIADGEIVMDKNVYDLHKPLHDESISLDHEAWNLYKPFSDYTSESDYYVLDFVKAQADTSIASDVFYRQINIIRHKDETLVASDFNAYDFVQGTKTETLITSDYSVINNLLAKHESILMSDDISEYTMIKRLADNVIPLDNTEIFDGSNYSFTKVFYDDFSTPDHEAWNLHKPFTVDSSRPLEGPAILAEDEFAMDYFADDYTLDLRPIISLTKALSEDRPVLDHSSFYFTKGTISDIVSAPDHYGSHIYKPFADGREVFDYRDWSLHKPFYETMLAPDYRDWSLHKPLTDSVLSPDHYISHLYKPFVDSVLMSDDISQYSLHKLLTDTVIPIDLAEIYDGSNYYLNKGLSDTQSHSEHHEYAIVKPLYDNELIEDHNSIFLTKGTFTELQTTADYRNWSFVKALANSVMPPDHEQWDLHKPLYDVQLLSDDQSFFVVKALANDVTSPDYNNWSLHKPLSEISVATIGPAILTTDEFAIDYFAGNYTEDYRPIWHLTKALNDQRPALDHIALDVVLGVIPVEAISNDEYISHFYKVASDSQYTNDDITQYTLHKLLTDTVIPIDLAEIFDGSNYYLNKGLADIVYESQHVEYNFNKVLVDSQYQLDHSIYDLHKPLYDVEIPTDDISEYTFGKSLTDTQYQGDDQSFNVELVKTDTEIIGDHTKYSMTKPLHDQQLQSDDDTYNFNKVLYDFETPMLGPVVFDSNGWAEDYVASGYIGDYRVVFDIHKPLHETEVITDYRNWNFNKHNFETLLASDHINTFGIIKRLSDYVTALDMTEIFDGSNYQVTKRLHETLTAPDAYKFDIVKGTITDVVVPQEFIPIHVTKGTFTEVLSTSDYNNWNFNKHNFETLVSSDDQTFDTTKSLSNTLSAPDHYQSLLNKPLSDNQLVSDTYSPLLHKPFTETLLSSDVFVEYTLGKALHEAIVSSETRKFNMSKVLSDTVITLDMADVFDGSTYQFFKGKTDSFMVSDTFAKVVTFSKTYTETQSIASKSSMIFQQVLGDSVTVTDDFEFYRSAGRVDLSDDTAGTTETGRVLMNDYIDITYFADDYIGQVRTF